MVKPTRIETEVATRPAKAVRRAPGAPPRQQGRPPRLTHGTQVAFNIVCSSCGAADTLPFVPKGNSPPLCSKCAKERFGEDWDHGRYGRDGDHEIVCVACGRHDFVAFEPEDPGAMLCSRCMRGEEKPAHGRVDGVTVDRRGGVKRRRTA
jgi:CxxC-x17-CxxC domain-containing protein